MDEIAIIYDIHIDEVYEIAKDSDRIVKPKPSYNHKFTFTQFVQFIDSYNDYYNHTLQAKTFFAKCRLPNFPEHISENLVRYALFHNTGILPEWGKKSGDLRVSNLKLEIKASLDLFNGGPSSFGPKESWDIIYFIDCKDTLVKKYSIYCIFLSNTSLEWKKLKFNSKETYEDLCKSGKRPRCNFKNIVSQIPEKYVKNIFSGCISKLKY